MMHHPNCHLASYCLTVDRPRPIARAYVCDPKSTKERTVKFDELFTVTFHINVLLFTFTWCR